MLKEIELAMHDKLIESLSSVQKIIGLNRRLETMITLKQYIS